MAITSKVDNNTYPPNSGGGDPLFDIVDNVNQTNKDRSYISSEKGGGNGIDEEGGFSQPKNRDPRVSVEQDFNQWKSTVPIADIPVTPSIIKPTKFATKSYMNKYAFISYGGSYLHPGSIQLRNSFIGDNGKMVPSYGTAGDIEKWKVPTAKNIIEWSRTLAPNPSSDKQAGDVGGSVTDSQKERQADLRDKSGSGGRSGINEDKSISKPQSARLNSTVNTGEDAIKFGEQSKESIKKINEKYGSGGSLLGLGNLQYDWKDFSFLKHFGQITNNYLVTLRRFKLPVLDNGIIAGKERLKSEVASGVENPENYLTSDSARALTYMGEGTGNTFNSFMGFSVGLNWKDHNISLDNPGINEGIRNPNNPLDNPIDGSELINKLFGTSINISENSGGFTRALSNWALQQKVDEEGLEDINEYIKTYSKDFDPYSNGWEHRIYGPINVVTRTSYRGRGLKFSNDTISLNFHYNTAQVGTMSPKLAMLDIISNMLALTYNSGQFYGGDYRFQRQPTNFPLPLQIVDAIERLSTGDSTVDYTELFKSMKRYAGSGIKQLANEAEKQFKAISSDENVKKAFDNIRKSTSDMVSKTEETKKTIDEMENTKNKSNGDKFGELFGDMVGFLPSAVESFFTGESNAMESMTTLIDALYNNINDDIDSNFSRVVVNSVLFDEQFDIDKIAEKIIRINPLITGEPVGEWHLTVGNPMNPMMMIGNLICTGMSMEFGEVMGADDFPTEIKFKVKLKHGRDRDMGDIESMFNLGQGRFYVPTEKSKEPWDTGFSTKNTENDTASVSEAQKKGFGTDGMAGGSNDSDESGASPDINNNVGEQSLSEEPEGVDTETVENAVTGFF